MIEEERAISDLGTGTLHRAGQTRDVAQCGMVMRPPLLVGPMSIVSEKARALCSRCFPLRGVA